jgi:hypothetical protein
MIKVKNLFTKKPRPKFESRYSGLAGADVRLFIDGKHMPLVQGISFGPIANEQPKGTIVFVLVDSAWHTELLGKTVDLGLVALAEKPITLYNAKIKFDDHENFGVAIDDIVIEASLSFTVIERFFENYILPKE